MVIKSLDDVRESTRVMVNLDGITGNFVCFKNGEVVEFIRYDLQTEGPFAIEGFVVARASVKLDNCVLVGKNNHSAIRSYAIGNGAKEYDERRNFLDRR